MAKLGSFSSIHQPADRVLRRRVNALALVPFVPYSFTAWTFTNGNSSGNAGPTTATLRSLYNTTGNTWINNDSYFSVTSGIQYWTVPASGVYTITVAGASGGGNIGRGAVATGTVSLTAGETIRILVGQMGATTNAYYGGGGGATFVMRTPFNSNASVVAIAGGGGGMSYRGGIGTGNTAPAGGTITTFPGQVAVRATGGGGGAGIAGTAGANGANATDSATGGWGAGGGGLLGKGGSSSTPGAGGQGGLSFTNGGTGGAKGASGADGGFGGGGGADNSGGGGGGYNGGSASTNNDAGGGGSSYLLNGVFTATANSNLGHGYVTIVSGGSALGNIIGTNTATISGATVGAANGSPFSSNVGSYTLASQPASAPYNYFSVPGGSGFAFGTDDYTIEWFQYMTASSVNQREFWYGTTPTLGVSVEGTDSSKSVYVWNGSAQLQGTIAVTANTWQHMALVRRSGRTYFYFNGNVINPSGTLNTANITDTTSVMYFGSKAGSGLQNEQFVGSMTNIRIVKGIAVYTGNFTVPTSPLAQTQVANPYGGANTSAIGYGFTTLLLSPPPPVVGDSLVNLDAATGVSGSTWTNTGSLGSSLNYSLLNSPTTTTVNGSTVLNFAGGAIQSPGSMTSQYAFNATGFGTALDSANGFTLDIWCQPSAVNDSGCLIREWGSVSGGLPASGWEDGWLAFSGGTIKAGFWAGSIAYGNAGTYTANNWYHITMVYNGSNNLTTYVNGVQAFSQTQTRMVSGTGTYLSIAACDRYSYLGTSNYFSGNVGAFKAYGRALTSTEVTQNYNALRARYGL